MGSRFICLLIITLMVVIVTPTIVAQPVFAKDTNVTLSVPCTIDGSVCSGSATCVTSIINPLGDVLYNNQSMTHNGGVFEVNLPSSDTSTTGEYQFIVACVQGGKSSSKQLIFFVTPNGEIPTTAKGILYGTLLLIFVLFFIIALYKGFESESIVQKSAFILTAYLILIGITFICMNLSADYLTSAPFLHSFFRIFWLFLMYALLPLILILTFYTLWMMKQIDAIQNMIENGMPIDEAYERSVKGGGKKNW